MKKLNIRALLLLSIATNFTCMHAYDFREVGSDKKSASSQATQEQRELQQAWSKEWNTNDLHADSRKNSSDDFEFGDITYELMEAPVIDISEQAPKGTSSDRASLWSRTTLKIAESLGLPTASKAIAAKIKAISDGALKALNKIVGDKNLSSTAKESRIKQLITSVTTSLQKLKDTLTRTKQATNNVSSEQGLEMVNMNSGKKTVDNPADELNFNNINPDQNTVVFKKDHNE